MLYAPAMSRKRMRLPDDTELVDSETCAPGSPSNKNNHAQRQQSLPIASEEPGLLGLHEDIIFIMLSFLDSKALVRMQAVCRAFADRTPMQRNQLSLTDKAAKAALLRKYGNNSWEAERWRHYSWLQRMRIEETDTPFDIERSERAGFKFVCGDDNTIEKLTLEGIGPKMLVSKDTTHNSTFLHWRLQLRGNNAVELGVIPEALQDSHKALHKCQLGPSQQRPTGMCSAITVGSLLPVRVPLMKGSDIEVLACKNRLEFLISQPADGYEMQWINSTTVPRPYVGPRQFKFELELDIQGPAKLALTCWAQAEFVVYTSSKYTNPLPSINNVAGQILNLEQPQHQQQQPQAQQQQEQQQMVIDQLINQPLVQQAQEAAVPEQQAGNGHNQHGHQVGIVPGLQNVIAIMVPALVQVPQVNAQGMAAAPHQLMTHPQHHLPVVQHAQFHGMQVNAPQQHAAQHNQQQPDSGDDEGRTSMSA